MASSVEDAELFEKVEMLQNGLVSRATGGNGLSDPTFRELRQLLVSHPKTSGLAPAFLRTNFDQHQFWQFIKRQSETYDGRRQYLWGQFAPLLAELEGQSNSPADQHVSEKLKRFDIGTVHSAWQKALDRRSEDPEGALTSARALLETVCKHILGQCNVKYEEDCDLPPAL